MFATNFQHFNSLVWLYQTTTPSSPYLNRRNQKTTKLWLLPYQFYWNLPEGNILAKFSVASLYVFFLLWSPRWNSRAISFSDIRTKASVGPGKAVQLSEKAKRAQFQSRLRIRDILFWSTTNKHDHDAHNDVLDVLCSDLNPSDANCQGQRALWFLKTIVRLTTILALVALVALVALEPFKSVLLQVLKRPLKNAKDTHCGRGHKGTLRNLNCRETASGTWISNRRAWKGTKLSNARKKKSF